MALEGRNLAPRALHGAQALALAVGFVLCGAVSAIGVAAPAASGVPPTNSAAAVDNGLGWRELTPQQREALRPLEREWGTIGLLQQRKWLELTGRMPKMSIDERARVQARMIDWAKLTPEQRSQARLRYEETKRVPLRDRQARWDAYQSLPSERKQQLAERASLAASVPRRATGLRERTARETGAARLEGATREPAARRTPVAPTLVQARPGATTTSIAGIAPPPVHAQAGMPRIAAAPDYVSRSTLLPLRGPQAAASAATR